LLVDGLWGIDGVTRWTVQEDSGQKTPRLLCPMKEEFRQDMKM
jgi:hypothetical protein